MSDDWNDNLTPTGRRRRAEILAVAITAGRRRRNRRWALRASLALAAVGIPAIFLMPSRQSPQPIARRDPAPATTPTPSIAITYIQADPSITARLAVRPGPPRWTVLTDGQLLDELAAAGRPAGIARIGTETKLLWADARK